MIKCDFRDYAVQGGSCLRGESDVYIQCKPNNQANVFTQWGEWSDAVF